MNNSKDEKVQKFLNEIEIMDGEKSHILNTARDIIFKKYPEVEERIMYGGIIFSLRDEHFSGLFVSKNHVSLEFSKGFMMADPYEVLEGSGKYRRHLKIKSKEEIINKHVDFFVSQASN